MKTCLLYFGLLPGLETDLDQFGSQPNFIKLHPNLFCCYVGELKISNVLEQKHLNPLCLTFATFNHLAATK